jgi:raffinose/stachyose/melibiose transport system permease protein
MMMARSYLFSAVACLYAVFSLLPVFVAIITSLKTSIDFTYNPAGISFYTGNYPEVFFNDLFGLFMKNTIVYSIAVIPAVLLLSFCCGYVFAREENKILQRLSFLFYGAMLIPETVFAVSFLYEMKYLMLVDNPVGDILSEIALQLPFGIFFMSVFISGIPKDVEEAARVDGASSFNMLRRIVLPLARNGVVTLALISFMFAWNRYFVPFVILYGEDVRTYTQSMSIFIGRYGTEYTTLAAAAVMGILPVLVLFVFFSRYFKAGFSVFAGTKG